MAIVCGWCEQVITNEQMATIHIHHDNRLCGFELPSSVWSEGDTFDEAIEKANMVLAEHEILCTHQLYYHSECCRECGAEMAMI
jgi:hypothetical protein